MHEHKTNKSRDLIFLSQTPKAIIITSHARLRIEQRGIKIQPLVKWLKSKELITVNLSDNEVEIPLPSKKRLVGYIDGNEIIITTALLEHFKTKLGPDILEKTKIRLSNKITVAEESIQEQQYIKRLYKNNKYRYPEIINGLISEKITQRNDARRKIVKIGSLVVPDLKTAYYKETSPYKWKIVQALGLVGTSQVLPFLESLTDSDDKKIRIIAQNSISKIKD